MPDSAPRPTQPLRRQSCCRFEPKAGLAREHGGEDGERRRQAEPRCGAGGLRAGPAGVGARGRAAALPFPIFPAVGCWGEALSRKGPGRSARVLGCQPTACPAVRGANCRGRGGPCGAWAVQSHSGVCPRGARLRSGLPAGEGRKVRPSNVAAKASASRAASLRCSCLSLAHGAAVSVRCRMGRESRLVVSLNFFALWKPRFFFSKAGTALNCRL